MTDQTDEMNGVASDHWKSGKSAASLPSDSSDVMSIAELSFDHQIAVWALRMFLQGSEAVLKVRDEFNNALPPAAGRIAFAAVERAIGTLRRYGKRNLRLNCMCNALLTRDEISVLVLLISLQGSDYEDMVRRARELVLDAGTHMLIDAVAILMSALAARHAEEKPENLALCLGDATVH